jgi:hypothetical protein
VVLELLDMFDTVGRKSGKRAPSTIRHVRPHVRTRSYFKDGRALAGKHCYYEKDGAESESTLFDLSVAK